MHEQLQGEIKYFITSPGVENPRPVETENNEDLNDEDSDDEKIEEPTQRELRTPTWKERFRELKNLYFPRRQAAVSDYQLEIRRIGYFQRMKQLFTRPHIRATTAATCVMAAQQLCGINASLPVVKMFPSSTQKPRTKSCSSTYIGRFHRDLLERTLANLYCLCRF